MLMCLERSYRLAADQLAVPVRDPVSGRHRRQKFPRRLVQSGDEPVLPADHRHLHGEDG
jgi:hypothetical protein